MRPGDAAQKPPGVSTIVFGATLGNTSPRLVMSNMTTIGKNDTFSLVKFPSARGRASFSGKLNSGKNSGCFLEFKSIYFRNRVAPLGRPGYGMLKVALRATSGHFTWVEMKGKLECYWLLRQKWRKSVQFLAIFGISKAHFRCKWGASYTRRLLRTIAGCWLRFMATSFWIFWRS